MKLNLVYATDENYLFATKVSAMSAMALASRPSDLILHILDCGISDPAWEALARTFPTVIRHKINLDALKEFPEWHGSLGAYARLYLPELLSDETWCFYVDGDTLFTNDLFEIEACYDSNIALMGHTTSFTTQPKWYDAHQIELCRSQYVCSGVILMNLRWMREHELTAQCMNFLKKYPDAPFPDQDALNLFCKGFIRFLPDTWGDYSGAAFGKISQPGCVHYVGELPWKLNWKWYIGYSDAVVVWVQCVKALLGIPRKVSTRIPTWKWILGRGYNKCIKYAVYVLGISSAFRNRFPNCYTRFLHPNHRKFYSRTFWHKREEFVTLCRKT